MTLYARHQAGPDGRCPSPVMKRRRASDETGGSRMSQAEAIARIDAFCDAVPRQRARAEDHGPLVLFVADGQGWPYYARPRLGPRDRITVSHVRKVRARQRELGVPASFEWIEQAAPELAPAAAGAGLNVAAHPLMILDGRPRGRGCLPELPCAGSGGTTRSSLASSPFPTWPSPTRGPAPARPARPSGTIWQPNGTRRACTGCARRWPPGTWCWPRRSATTDRWPQGAASRSTAWPRSPGWARCRARAGAVWARP